MQLQVLACCFFINPAQVVYFLTVLLVVGSGTHTLLHSDVASEIDHWFMNLGRDRFHHRA